MLLIVGSYGLVYVRGGRWSLARSLSERYVRSGDVLRAKRFIMRTIGVSVPKSFCTWFVLWAGFVKSHCVLLDTTN